MDYIALYKSMAVALLMLSDYSLFIDPPHYYNYPKFCFSDNDYTILNQMINTTYLNNEMAREFYFTQKRIWDCINSSKYKTDIIPYNSTKGCPTKKLKLLEADNRDFMSASPIKTA